MHAALVIAVIRALVCSVCGGVGAVRMPCLLGAQGEHRGTLRCRRCSIRRGNNRACRSTSDSQAKGHP